MKATDSDGQAIHEWDAYGEAQGDLALIDWEILNMKSMPQTSHIRSELAIAYEDRQRVRARLARIAQGLGVAA